MFLPITTSRDILVFQQNESCLTIAADTLGAIGEKPADLFRASPELCGRMTARVCLMETLSVGAHPFSLMALTCNEREPTGVTRRVNPWVLRLIIPGYLQMQSV
jgi:hypothetical protein